MSAAAVSVLLATACADRGNRPRVIHEVESSFGRIRVTERADGLRTLHTGVGNATQTALYPGRPQHLELPYTRVAMIGPALAPPDGKVLFVGLGGGAMPMFTRHVMPQATIDVVEIDPAIIDVAGSHFGFRADVQLRVHAGDGRAFIEDAQPGTWDVIVLDAFSDDEVPFSLTTAQFLASVRSSLTADGVVVSNLWTANPAYASMLATYDAVFDQVHLVAVAGRPQVILIAGPAARRLDEPALVRAARALSQRVDIGFDLSALVERGYDTPRVQRAPVLHDERSGS